MRYGPYRPQDVTKVESINVATTTNREDVDSVTVDVPEGVTCTVTLEDGVLTLEGEPGGGNITGGVFFQAGSISGAVPAGVVQVTIPLNHRVNISNVHR